MLENVEREALDAEDRRRLRLVAITHDAFKYKVDHSRPRSGENHHGAYARTFTARFTDDDELLEVIELHDEAYNAWRSGRRGKRPEKATQRALRLIDRLGPAVDFYLRFFRADNATGTKTPEPVAWFTEILRSR